MNPLPKIVLLADTKNAGVYLKSVKERQVALIARLKGINDLLPCHVDDDWDLRETSKRLIELINELEAEQ
jgi:hypothetical protein